MRQVAIPILEAALSDLTIPDISGSAGTPIGSIDYSLSKLVPILCILHGLKAWFEVLYIIKLKGMTKLPCTV